MTARDVAIARRRALIAMVNAEVIELRYIEERHGLRPHRFDGRHDLAPAAARETCDRNGAAAAVRVVMTDP